MIERNGFLITGLQLFYLDEVNAEEFFEIYRGVVPEYMVCILNYYTVFLYTRQLAVKVIKY